MWKAGPGFGEFRLVEPLKDVVPSSKHISRLKNYCLEEL